MLSAATIVSLMIEAICGAVGGLAVGRWANNVSLGPLINALAGAIGGLILTWLVAHTPGIDRFVASTAALSQPEPVLMIGVGISGLLGGVLFTLALGFLRKLAGTWEQ